MSNILNVATTHEKKVHNSFMLQGLLQLSESNTVLTNVDEAKGTCQLESQHCITKLGMENIYFFHILVHTKTRKTLQE
jgi:hypothetical protein